MLKGLTKAYLSIPGSSIHGIFQARVMEWGAIAFSACGRLWQFAHPRPLSLLQRGLAPRSKGTQSPGREAALAWASLAQRSPASSVLAREGAPSSKKGHTLLRLKYAHTHAHTHTKTEKRKQSERATHSHTERDIHAQRKYLGTGGAGGY